MCVFFIQSYRLEYFIFIYCTSKNLINITFTKHTNTSTPNFQCTPTFTISHPHSIFIDRFSLRFIKINCLIQFCSINFLIDFCTEKRSWKWNNFCLIVLTLLNILLWNFFTSIWRFQFLMVRDFFLFEMHHFSLKTLTYFLIFLFWVCSPVSTAPFHHFWLSSLAQPQ